MAPSLTSVAPGDRPWHVRDAVKVAATLRVVDPGRGLEETDVAERRARFGRNRLREAARRRPWADRTDMMFMNTLVTRAADLRGDRDRHGHPAGRHRRAPGSGQGRTDRPAMMSLSV
jgi:hypothetical protein